MEPASRACHEDEEAACEPLQLTPCLCSSVGWAVLGKAPGLSLIFLFRPPLV